ncbi:MAG: response regulator [Anaerolineae bacterium]|nr:response regulator [Anaerolineae bacterium]
MTPTDAHRLLLIDADESFIKPIQAYFEAEGFAVNLAQTPDQGVHLAARYRPDLILLAATVGSTDGVEVFRRLRRAPLSAHIPIMFIANRKDAQRQNRLLAEGADDVIVQPVDVEILSLRVRNAIQRTRREGLTEPRTGLPTGALIEEQIAHTAQQRDRQALILRIAAFETFRDRYDFITGNDVLRYAATAICEAVDEVGGEQDFVGHRRGAEFVVVTGRDRAAALQDRLKAEVNDGLLQFYNFMEREQGYVLIDGDERPLMSLEIE